MKQNSGKKTEQLNIALTEEIAADIEAIYRRTGVKGTEMGRIGLVEVVNRLKADAPPTIDLEMVQAIESVRRLGLDPRQILMEAASALIECPPAPSPPAPEPESAVA